MEFRFGERAGGCGIASVSVFVGWSAGLGLVPRAADGLRAVRGGIGRPPVVLGLLGGMAGSSASVRGGGVIPLFCCSVGGGPGGGVNCWSC
jgi:hypothetical protein